MSALGAAWAHVSPGFTWFRGLGLRVYRVPKP